MRFEAGTYIDITGKRYGMLTVLGFSHFSEWPSQKGKGRRTFWICQCDCGKEVIRRKDSLTNILLRNTVYKSCGCMSKEVSRQRLVKAHADGINPCAYGDDHWTRKEPERARKIALKNLKIKGEQ